MRERLRQAATDGLVLGVKYGVALAVLAAVILLCLGDYGVTRQRAYNGQLAHEYLQKMVQQQQTQAK